MKKIRLTKGKCALADDEDYESLSLRPWCYSVRGYAVTRMHGRVVTMHRVITKATKKYQVDHINQNKLDNRKSNLRLCTHYQNGLNKKKTKGRTSRTKRSSKYKGVSWCKRDKYWCAELKFKGKHRMRKHFSDEIMAAAAYNEAAIKYHGKFANLNKIGRYKNDKSR